MPGSLESLDLRIQIPYHFRCPISIELMRDPVTVCTGQTYDRSSIESWIATGNTTCPVTRAPLTDFTFIPNHTLRRLIQGWCVENKSFGLERIPTPKQPAEPGLVRTLVSQAGSESNTYSSRLSALRRLRGLACDSDKNCCVISSHNVREIVTNILFSDMNSGSFLELSHESLALLVMFQLAESECMDIAAEPDKVTYLSNLLFHPSIEVRLNSATLIENILVGMRSQELRSQMSNVDEIFEGVIEILNLQSYPRGLKVGVKALFTLCLIKQTRQKAVEAGAAETLIVRLADFDNCDAERALATVELLCRIPTGCAAFAEHALTVPLLVKMILKISDRATEYAVGALLYLCSSSEQCQGDAVNASVLTQLLLLMQSDCTERAKRKAQLLLKLLWNRWPEDSIANSDDFACSEAVPF